MNEMPKQAYWKHTNTRCDSLSNVCSPLPVSEACRLQEASAEGHTAEQSSFRRFESCPTSIEVPSNQSKTNHTSTKRLSHCAFSHGFPKYSTKFRECLLESRLRINRRDHSHKTWAHITHTHTQPQQWNARSCDCKIFVPCKWQRLSPHLTYGESRVKICGVNYSIQQKVPHVFVIYGVRSCCDTKQRKRSLFTHAKANRYSERSHHATLKVVTKNMLNLNKRYIKVLISWRRLQQSMRAQQEKQ